MFGKDRFVEAAASASHRDAEQIRSAVVEAVRAFRGVCPQQDDVTLVVIKTL